MATIVRQLPFRPYDAELAIPGRDEKVKILHRQVVLWVSLSPPGIESLPARHACFPAVLDLGLNESFVIRHDQLENWAALDLNTLTLLDEVELFGRKVRALDADVWLHRNVPLSREQLLDLPPFHIEIDAGILISPLADRPRLPLLGMRAFESAGLQLLVDGLRQSVSIRAATRSA